MDSHLHDEIADILDRAVDMTVATVREDGYPQATTVSFVNDGLTLYFGCGARSQKADNIRRDGRVSITVNLPYANWNEIRSLSLGGVAALVTDPAEIDRVMARMTTKFPQVADFALTSDAQMALVRVTPQVVSVLDYAKGFGHTDLVHLCDAGTSASSATAGAPPATAP